MEFSHKPVLLTEAIDALEIKLGGIYVDGTAGGGGHSAEIAARLSAGGRLICIDQDPDAISVLRERLGSLPQVTIVQENFARLDTVLSRLGISSVDGILVDLGVSSHQLDTPERGFPSMRMHRSICGCPSEGRQRRSFCVRWTSVPFRAF